MRFWPQLQECNFWLFLRGISDLLNVLYESKVSMKNVLELLLVLKYNGDRNVFFFNSKIIFYPFEMDVCICVFLSKKCLKKQFGHGVFCKHSHVGSMHLLCELWKISTPSFPSLLWFVSNFLELHLIYSPPLNHSIELVLSAFVKPGCSKALHILSNLILTIIPWHK